MKIAVVSQAPVRGDLIQFHTQGSFRRPEVPAAEFSGKKLSRLLLRESGRRVMHAGLGPTSAVATDILREVTGAAVKALMKIGAEDIAVQLDEHSGHAQAVVEGALLAAYKFEAYRNQEARRSNQLRRLTLVARSTAHRQVKDAAATGQILAEATNFTRALGNEPPNVITPAVLAQKAKTIAALWKFKCRVWDQVALRREGFGGLVAVGSGSANPPRLIVMEMFRGAKSKPPIVLVGKAITFDSGGISLKPGDRMEEMKFDKMGGCAVLGIMQAVAQLRLPINLVGVIPSAENMPSSQAYRPGDLVETWDGKVIEVLNTDAEGRVILADALAYARETYHPRLMIDLATLTGACVVGLGARRAGLFTQREEIRKRLWDLGTQTGDWVWPLPMRDEFEDQIRSEIALVKNTGGREGGACTAATFLRHWAGDVPWVHLDIAGPAWITKELPHLEIGATGFGVRLVTEYLRETVGR